jgi:tetratricopeptide (TPR) repeat protein
LKAGQVEEALEDFRQALRRPPLVWNVDGVEDCLADAYLELGRLDEAVSEYNRLLGINPQYAPARLHLAEAYQRKGERELARAASQQFLQIWAAADPDTPEVILAKSLPGSWPQ